MNNVKSTVSAVRAIGVEFARRIYAPVLIVAIIIAVVLIGLMIWLVTVSAWWLILAVPVFFVILVASVIFIIARIIIVLVNPGQTKQQKKDVKGFVDKLQNLSEVTQTPKPVLLFRIIKDIASSNQDGFVKRTIGHTLSLRTEFEAIQRSFDTL